MNVVVDFDVIPTNNPKRLWITDASDWGVAENQASVIEITPPGSKVSINNTFIKRNLNVFHSVNLKLSCVNTCVDQQYQDLPDGVWSITLKSSFTDLNKTRYYLKTDQTQLQIDKIYVRAGLEFDKSQKAFREDLQDIEFLIRSASAWTRLGNSFKASRDFIQAQELLIKYQNCVNCI